MIPFERNYVSGTELPPRSTFPGKPFLAVSLTRCKASILLYSLRASILGFIPPATEQGGGNSIALIHLRTLTFLISPSGLCHFSAGDRSIRSFLPILPPDWIR